MTKDEAMRIALEALVNNRYIIESEINLPEALEEVDVAITALRQALEQPEQEPVAWCELNGIGEIDYFDGRAMIMPGKVGNDCHPVPLYTAPPIKPWVSLTGDEIDDIASESGFGYINVARSIEAALKEKNN